MSAQNVMASISRTLGNREHKPTGNEIRLADDERKDKLYEPKHKQKLIRVLTVVAYVIFVSMVAILLSLYYTFLWDPKDVPIVRPRPKSECANSKLQNSFTTPFSVNETQAKKTTKLVTATDEQSPTQEIVTAEQQENNLITISTESADTSSSASPLTMSEDLQQTNASIETKETSTKIHSKINQTS
ncbi:hypothetical protein WH47_04725 [Habropoda laboriosa]|uniref:Transmembrane protein INAFM2 n=1 Tax=Habropoda laboriosa TaxID=597456 RepID=A0A0L7QXJ1_9HYME|nr:hypothetical protein WH47_04725 [Habropoda laboriosa]